MSSHGHVCITCPQKWNISTRICHLSMSSTCYLESNPYGACACRRCPGLCCDVLADMNLHARRSRVLCGVEELIRDSTPLITSVVAPHSSVTVAFPEPVLPCLQITHFIGSPMRINSAPHVHSAELRLHTEASAGRSGPHPRRHWYSVQIGRASCRERV